MWRLWFSLAGVALVVGAVHTAYEYGFMDGTAEGNSAPSGVAFVYLIPYVLVALVLAVIGGITAHRTRMR